MIFFLFIYSILHSQFARYWACEFFTIFFSIWCVCYLILRIHRRQIGIKISSAVFSLLFWGCVHVHVCACPHMWVGVHEHIFVYILRSEDNLRCHSLGAVNTVFWERVSHWPEGHEVGQAFWPASAGNLFVSAFPVLWLYVCITACEFCAKISGPHVCATSTLWIDFSLHLPSGLRSNVRFLFS